MLQQLIKDPNHLHTEECYPQFNPFPEACIYCNCRNGPFGYEYCYWHEEELDKDFYFGTD